MTRKAIYIGKGAYIEGVPARDLSADEWAEIPPELQDKAIAAGTHKLVRAEAAPKKEGE